MPALVAHRAALYPALDLIMPRLEELRPHIGAPPASLQPRVHGLQPDVHATAVAPVHPGALLARMDVIGPYVPRLAPHLDRLLPHTQLLLLQLDLIAPHLDELTSAPNLETLLPHLPELAPVLAALAPHLPVLLEKLPVLQPVRPREPTAPPSPRP